MNAKFPCNQRSLPKLFRRFAAIAAVCGVLGALSLFWATRHSFLRFLFERPQRFWLAPKPLLELGTAEEPAR